MNLRLAAALAGFISLVAQPLQPALAESKPAVSAKSDIEARRALAAELTMLVNHADAVESWKRSLVSSQNFSQCGCSIPKETQAKLKDAWQKAVSEEFNAKEVVALLEAAGAEGLTVPELKEAVAFRKSLLGARVTAAETAYRAADKDPASVMQRFAAAQKALDANPARKANLRKIVASIGGGRSLTNAMINISIGTAMGASAIAPKDQPRPSEGDILEMIEAARPQMEASIGKMMLPMYGALYAVLSDKDIAALASAMSKPAARKYSDVADNAFNTALRAQALKMGRRFAQEMQAEKI